MSFDSKFRRQTVRAALSIHDQLTSSGAQISRLRLPESSWEALRRITRRLEVTATRGWHTAHQHLVDELDYFLRMLNRELDVVREELSAAPKLRQVSSARDIVADLEAIAGEFEGFTLDRKQQSLSVLTEPIELEGTYLGSFQIVLRWDQIGIQKAYEVIATEPFAAAGESDVTHPHVRDQSLCEGEGAAPIKAALAQGRLLDFFILVRQILETYNAESAHVGLEGWDGASCRDCGWRMPSSERGTCERCGASVCGECSSSCESCDRYVCGDCSGSCADCGSSLCSSCVATPDDVPRQLCETCHSHSTEENHDSDDDQSADNEPADDPAPLWTESTPDSGDTATLYPVCLGEAAVPA